MQHVVPNNVAICCVDMLRSFGRGFSNVFVWQVKSSVLGKCSQAAVLSQLNLQVWSKQIVINVNKQLMSNLQEGVIV